MDKQFSATELQIHLLKLQIELEESNYKYALELQKDVMLLIRLKDRIKELKELLQLLQSSKRIIALIIYFPYLFLWKMNLYYILKMPILTAKWVIEKRILQKKNTMLLWFLIRFLRKRKKYFTHE